VLGYGQGSAVSSGIASPSCRVRTATFACTEAFTGWYVGSHPLLPTQEVMLCRKPSGVESQRGSSAQAGPTSAACGPSAAIRRRTSTMSTRSTASSRSAGAGPSRADRHSRRPSSSGTRPAATAAPTSRSRDLSCTLMCSDPGNCDQAQTQLQAQQACVESIVMRQTMAHDSINSAQHFGDRGT